VNLTFYRRDALHSAVFAVETWPSVTRWYCSIKTDKDIGLRPPDSPIILFLTPSAGTQFQGEPLQRGTKYTEVGKISDFRITKVLNIYTAKHV